MDETETNLESNPHCPKCGSEYTEAVVLDCYGIETNCYMCEDCSYAFGGDLD